MFFWTITLIHTGKSWGVCCLCFSALWSTYSIQEAKEFSAKISYGLSAKVHHATISFWSPTASLRWCQKVKMLFFSSLELAGLPLSTTSGNAVQAPRIPCFPLCFSKKPLLSGSQHVFHMCVPVFHRDKCSWDLSMVLEKLKIFSNYSKMLFVLFTRLAFESMIQNSDG